MANDEQPFHGAGTETLDTPRWRGGPCICKATNLPAFATKEKLLWAIYGQYKAGNPLYEGVKLVRVGKCGVCQMWHAETLPRDPAGSSSGSGRSTKEH